MNDLLKEIAVEDDTEGFDGGVNYSKKSSNFQFLPTYKVWNPNPQNLDAPKTPGMVMVTVDGDGKDKTKKLETVQTIKAVILFSSHGRKFAVGQGKTYEVKCCSHDGENPSVRIKAPFCRQSTAQDVAQIFAKWKGMDQTKIDAKVKEVTNGAGKLQVCGLKGNGVIALCSKARFNEDERRAGPCKPNIYIQAYDTERKREFRMELTGGSIRYDNKFISPIHEFFKYLQTATDKPLNCYNFEVELSSTPNGAFYLLNVKNWKVIDDGTVRADMKRRALEAREAYEKDASRLSKEDWEKVKALPQADSKNEPGSVAEAYDKAIDKTEQPKEVSFEDDDLPTGFEDRPDA